MEGRAQIPPEAALACSARVRLISPAERLAQLCEHFKEYADHVEWSAKEGLSRFSYGTARLRAVDDMLVMEASAADESSLAYVRLSLAHHLESFAADETPEIVWQGDGCDQTRLPYFREMRVVGAASVTPHMRRLTLSGQDIARYAEGGLHIRLVIPPAGQAEPLWPTMGKNGLPSFPQGEGRPDLRTYTIRRIDVAAGLIDVDIVLHEGDTVGSAFARRVQPGDQVGIMGPGGGDATDADWYLLAGDETALPAIARILEHLPDHARGEAIIEVSDRAEEQPLARPAGVALRWLHRGGAPAGTTTALTEAVRAVALPGDDRIFVWAAAEFATFKALRRHFREDCGLRKDQHLVAAYWRRGLKEGERERS